MKVNDEKYLARIEIVGDHHIWTGPLKNGYGRVYASKNEKGEKHRLLTHHYAILRLDIEIPKGMIVCHRYDVRPCVNVDHLYIGDRQDNALDYYHRLATDEWKENLRQAVMNSWDRDYEQRCENMSIGALNRRPRA